MDTLVQDCRHGLRGLRRAPGFAAVATLTLALGIGANTAIFSVVDALLLNPLPFAGGGRLAFLWLSAPRSEFMVVPGAALAEAWRQGARSLEGLEAYTSGEFRRTGPGGGEVLEGAVVSPTFLSFLGLAPALGRMFSEEEARVGAPVVLLGYGYWKREFGGRRDVLGRTVELDGRSHTVIGVMPARLRRLEDADVWLPLPPGRDGFRTVVARLRPGVPEARVLRELDALAAAASLPPGPESTWRARIVRPQDFLGDGLRRALLVLAGAVGLVLLIACANVAHLLLARAAEREREFAVRVALGAGWPRLLRQLVAESLLLALGGGALGLLFAWWGLDAIIGLRPEALGELARAGIDGRVLLFCLALSVLTVLLFGLVPALRAARPDPAAALKAAGPGSTGSATRTRFRNVLLAIEVALTVVLLVGAGLLIRSLVHLQSIDPGFRPEGLLVVRASLPEARYPTPASREAFREELLARAARLPGVAAATLALSAPPRYGVSFARPEVEGGGPPDPALPSIVSKNFVRGDYFQVLGIRLLEGRSFTEEEVRTRAPVVIVSERTAKRLWPDGRALGRRVRFGSQGEWKTVVGVVADVAAGGPTEAGPRLQVYEPFAELESERGYAGAPEALIVRTRGDPTRLAPMLRALVGSVEPEAVVRQVATAESLLADTLAAPRFNATLLTVFAAVALALAAVGLAGVLSYAVSQRTREIGVRIALGARGPDVLRLVLRQAAAPVALGAALGLATAVAGTRVMRSLLHGVSPLDPLVYAAVPLLLAAVALLAGYVPARRAARVDPMAALRAE